MNGRFRTLFSASMGGTLLIAVSARFSHEYSGISLPSNIESAKFALQQLGIQDALVIFFTIFALCTIFSNRIRESMGVLAPIGTIFAAITLTPTYGLSDIITVSFIPKPIVEFSLIAGVWMLCAEACRQHVSMYQK